MALRKIVTLGDEALRKECKKVDKFNLRLHLLLKDMLDTMYEANGVGLAAPQVSQQQRRGDDDQQRGERLHLGLLPAGTLEGRSG